MDRKWWTLIAVSIAIFMLLLDITVVNVALPVDPASLHSSFTDLQWVVNAYALTLAAFLLTAGSSGRPVRPPSVSSRPASGCSPAPPLVCGLLDSPLMLNLSRAVQGVGGAIMFATSLALIAQAFQRPRPRDRLRGLRRRHRRGRRDRPAGRRGHHHRHRLAVDLLRQRPDRRGRDRPHPHARDRVARSQRDRGRLARPRHLLRRRCSCSCTRWSRATKPAGARTEIVALLIACRAAARGVPDRRGPPGAADARPLRSSAAPPSRGPTRRLRPLGSIFALFLYLTLYIQDVLGYGALQAGLRFLPITVLSFIVAPIAGRLTVRVPVRLLLGGGLAAGGGGLLAMTAVDADLRVDRADPRLRRSRARASA